MTSSKEKTCCEKCYSPLYDYMKEMGDELSACTNSRCPCHKEKVVFPCPKCEGADVPTHTPSCIASNPKTEEKVRFFGNNIREAVKNIQDFSGATFEQHHEHKTEEWEEEFTRRFLDYFDDGSKSPNIKPFHEIKSHVSSLILKTKEQERDLFEAQADRAFDRGRRAGFEMGQKEERERILAMIDALPDLDILGNYKAINAHKLVCAIQEQDKKEE